MRISFYGASVTQQKTGYVHEFKKLAGKDITVYQHGYGGMHLCDAGVIYIDDVLKNNPDICFIDWFSTGYLTENVNFLPYLQTLITKFSYNNVKLVFLFFPRNPFEELRNIMYEYAKGYITECNITHIELDVKYSNLKKNLIIKNDILRDVIHTTDLGSKKYAEFIFDYFSKNITNLKVCNKLPQKNKYYNIKSINFNNPIVVTNEFNLNGSCEMFCLNIDKCPNSGIIYANNKEINIWDQWCYFTRKSIVTIDSFENKLNIKISNKEFDKSTCKIKDFEWHKHEKKLIIYNIYYIGNLEINNL